MIGRLRLLLWPGVMTAAMLAVLLGLGTWQVERLHWKQALLAQIARAEAAPAVPLPAEPEPFTKVQVTGRCATICAPLRRRGARHAGRAATRHAADRAAGTRRTATPVLVDRGWVP